jgi:pimeloyl-ACP methyl ester carboxylesterase
MGLRHHRTGTGEPLVLIHGIGSRWQVWGPVIERLAGDRDVIALDLPGFASSPPPPPGTPAGAPSLARLVAEFFDELGLERPHVAGNSLGGWVGLELAKLGRAASVTCLSPAGFHNDREGRFERLSLATTAAVARRVAPVADALSRLSVTRTLVFFQVVGKPWNMSPEDAALTIDGVARAAWFDETLVAITAKERFSGGEQIDVPVTIAWGNLDRLLLPRQGTRAVRAIPGARLITLAGCGHLPTFDDPEQVARVLLEGSSSRLEASSSPPAPAPA